MALDLTHGSAMEYETIIYGNMTPEMAAEYLRGERISIRSFSDTLRKMYPCDDIQKKLKQFFRNILVDGKRSSMDRKIQNWMSGQNQPTNREDYFRIAFALELTEAQLNFLLGMCTDYTIQYRDGREAVLAWFLRNGYGYQEAVDFLKKMVEAGYNIFISGGTGSGKTTFLNALSNYIPEDERIITIEDNAELQIRGSRNLVRLEARRPNAEGEGEVTIRDLIRSSLRMRPDRIIVGEVRGEETIDMLQSLNTGHDGSLSTGHGNSPRDMLSRLETMVIMGMEIPVAAIRRQIASGIDLMVHLSRMRDKSRKVLEILEIDGYDVQTGEIRTHTIFEYLGLGEDKDGKLTGSLVKTGQLIHTQKLERAGIAA